MRRALVVAAGLAVSVSVSAQQRTKTFDYKPVDGIQAIQLGLDEVKVDQIVFRTAKDVGTGPRQRSNSETVVRVENASQAPVAVGVAVVAMDEGGNIVAAGSGGTSGGGVWCWIAGGTRAGWLAPGGRESVAIRFPYVYRNLAKAKKFTLTIEVEPKTGAAAPAPEAGQ